MLNTPVEQRRRAQRAPLSLLAFLLFLTVFVTAQMWIARRLDDSATERLVPVSLTAPCAPFRLPHGDGPHSRSVSRHLPTPRFDQASEVEDLKHRIAELQQQLESVSCILPSLASPVLCLHVHSRFRMYVCDFACVRWE